MSNERLLVGLRSIGIDDADLARAVEIMEAATEGSGTAGTGESAVSELDAALADGAGQLVAVGDQLFALRSIGGGTFLRFTAALGSGDEAAMVTAAARIIAAIVDPADAERLYDAVDAAGWGVEQTMDWLMHHIEVATGRPTGPPSPSAPRRAGPTPSSNGASPPTATRSS